MGRKSGGSHPVGDEGGTLAEVRDDMHVFESAARTVVPFDPTDEDAGDSVRTLGSCLGIGFGIALARVADEDKLEFREARHE